MRWVDIIGKPEVKGAILTYVQKSRWYGEKSKSLLKFEIESCFLAQETNTVLAVLSFRFKDRTSARYQLFLNLVPKQSLSEKNDAGEIEGIITTFAYGLEMLVLQDAFQEPRFRRFLFKLIANSKEVQLDSIQPNSKASVTLKGIQGRKFKSIAPSNRFSKQSGVLGLEQSNTSLYFGKKGARKSLFVKFYRKQVEGKNPDAELSEYLTDEAGFKHSAKFAGEILLTNQSKRPTVVALALGFSPNQSDAWHLFKSKASDYYSSVHSKKLQSEIPPKDLFSDWSPEKPLLQVIGKETLSMVGLLGKRTAQMHLALSAAKEKDLIPQKMKESDIHAVLTKTKNLLELELKGLKTQLPALEPNEATLAEQVLKAKKELSNGLKLTSKRPLKLVKQRVHGDYHLGQVLFTGEDFTIIDFEGEPARPIEERRERYSVCKDLAGMIRSLHYAAYAGIYQHPTLNEKAKEKSEPFAEAWFFVLARAFLKSYLGHVKGKKLLPKEISEISFFLNAYLLDKVMYELAYERNNRPKWLRIPLQGILSLLKADK
ncbi:MAG: hypothetical protein SFU91_06585 [Chloroherpetonaceae bacterium]|nr:hypothetical protein [Chloroherpetonaceae bacterium]